MSARACNFDEKILIFLREIVDDERSIPQCAETDLLVLCKQIGMTPDEIEIIKDTLAKKEDVCLSARIFTGMYVLFTIKVNQAKEIRKVYNDTISNFNSKIDEYYNQVYQTAVSKFMGMGYSGSYAETKGKELMQSRDIKKLITDQVKEITKTIEQLGIKPKMRDEFHFAPNDDMMDLIKSKQHEEDLLSLSAYLKRVQVISDCEELIVTYTEAILRRMGIADSTLKKAHDLVDIQVEATVDRDVISKQQKQAAAASQMYFLEGMSGAVVNENGTVTLLQSEDEEKWVLQEENVADVVLFLHCYVVLGKDGTLSVSAQPCSYADQKSAKKTILQLHDKLCSSSSKLSEWYDLVSITSCDGALLLGLKRDGTVLGYSEENKKLCNQLASWTNIKQISGAGDIVAGLKQDGTVVCCGNSMCNTSGWRDIVSVVCGSVTYESAMEEQKDYPYVLGLKADGTVVFAGNAIPGREREYRQFTSLRNIVQFYYSCDEDAFFFVDSAGNVKEILYRSVYTSHYFTDTDDVGYEDEDSEDEIDVRELQDIIATNGSLFIQRDGSVYKQAKQLFRNLDEMMAQYEQYEQDRTNQREDALQRRSDLEEAIRIMETRAQYRSLRICQHCGGKFKGFFKKTCSVCGRPKDY